MADDEGRETFVGGLFGALPRARRRRLAAALVATLAGLVCLVAGWIGVSGTRVVSSQLAYVASGTAAGLGLLAVAGALVVGDFMLEVRESLFGVRQDIRLLMEAIVGSVDPGSARALSVDSPWSKGRDVFVTLPGSERVHRAGCGLVGGKPEARVISADEAATARLRPCRSCRPDLDALSSVASDAH